MSCQGFTQRNYNKQKYEVIYQHVYDSYFGHNSKHIVHASIFNNIVLFSFCANVKHAFADKIISS